MGAATCMTKHAGINSPSSPASHLSTSVSVRVPTPPSVSPSLSRFLHRQHEHRRRNGGRLRGPGFPHDAPRHQEPGFWKTPPLRQRYKQILQLSSWDARASERSSSQARRRRHRFPGCSARTILFASVCVTQTLERESFFFFLNVCDNH